jgi:hypothetical protein
VGSVAAGAVGAVVVGWLPQAARLSNSKQARALRQRFRVAFIVPLCANKKRECNGGCLSCAKNEQAIA